MQGKIASAKIEALASYTHNQAKIIGKGEFTKSSCFNADEILLLDRDY